MLRCPIVLERLAIDEATGQIIYHARPGRTETARFDPYELIAAVLDHLPPPHQQLARYWGHYANASRGKRRAAARGADPDAADLHHTYTPAVAFPPEDPPYRHRARLTWAALLKKIHEVDPSLCVYCGAEMKIIAFITEHATVCRILKHIQMPAQRPEPLAHSPPLQEELLYA
jgi:hypothetical protein